VLLPRPWALLESSLLAARQRTTERWGGGSYKGLPAWGSGTNADTRKESSQLGIAPPAAPIVPRDVELVHIACAVCDGARDKSTLTAGRVTTLVSLNSADGKECA